ncbi:thiolase-like protein [Aspergillus campestris IBT 28561]|uniref:Thiolase-like protein n=1 Tax=Aspergillus campestris (strain IBT 28561) TaxID=1392248 RepID=A0A2I1CW98_ASPC2|nr:thiolase-like protein [Aspergillus campestris IBT 28561]PKY01889.1 thiolase-like protein [Aspergillus campestris IBT 28561]
MKSLLYTAISRLTPEQVKPNVGHSEGASGLTSVIKSVLALEHRVIPPIARLQNRHPAGKLIAHYQVVLVTDRAIPVPLNLRIAKELTPWPEDRDERVSVNSFGIGGANSHVILESARSHLPRVKVPTVGRRHMSPSLVPVSATSANSLAGQIQLVKDYCKSRTVAAQDLAHTLGTRRDHHQHRAFALMTGENSISELAAFESGAASTKPPKQLVFVFTGQGAQWPGMGKELMPAFDGFRTDIRRLDNVLQSLPNPPTWSMEGTCRISTAAIMTPFRFLASLFPLLRGPTLSLSSLGFFRLDIIFSCHRTSH